MQKLIANDIDSNKCLTIYGIDLYIKISFGS